MKKPYCCFSYIFNNIWNISQHEDVIVLNIKLLLPSARNNVTKDSL